MFHRRLFSNLAIDYVTVHVSWSCEEYAGYSEPLSGEFTCRIPSSKIPEPDDIVDGRPYWFGYGKLSWVRNYGPEVFQNKFKEAHQMCGYADGHAELVENGIINATVAFFGSQAA